MIIHSLEDVRFTLGEGAWIDKSPRRGEFLPLKDKLRVARLAFALDNFPDYKLESGGVQRASENGGRFLDQVDEVLFNLGMKEMDTLDPSKDWKTEHALATTFDVPQLRLLGVYARVGYKIATEGYYVDYGQVLDDQTDRMREVLEDHPNPESVPGFEALQFLASDNEMAIDLRGATVESVQNSNLNDMTTTAFIARTVHNYLSQNS